MLGLHWEKVTGLYSNQSASSTISEQRDLMRAIVALQQAQRDGLTFKESKEREMTKTRLGETRRQPSSTGTHKSLTSDADEADSPPLVISAHSSAVSPSRNPSARMKIKAVGINPSYQTYPEANRSRELDPQDVHLPLNSYMTAVQISSFPSVTTSDRMDWPGGSDTERPPPLGKKSSGNPHRSGSKLNMELQLFLMKPIVQDFFDKIELTWSVHNPKMQDSAIRKYMAKNEDDGIPSVLDMLHTLHDYERTVVDSKMHDRVSGCEGSLLSLKRTKTEILHRNITLKDVPGLQFVVERAILPPGPHMWNRREGMPPPPQRTIPYTISGYNYAPQDQPTQLVIPEQQLKRKMLVDAGRKKPTRKRFSQGTHTPPPGVPDPQIRDEDTTDEELFIIPLSSRAQASNRSPSPNDQYTSYDRSESSIPGPIKGRDYQQAIPIRTNERPQLTASVNTSSKSDAPSNYPLLASHQLQAKLSLGMAHSEQKGHSYRDETSLPTTEEPSWVEAFKARATSRTQDGNKENKKVLTRDVQKMKAPVHDPSVLTSMSGAEAPYEPLYDSYLPSSEDSSHEVRKKDSTELPSSVKPKLRKQRGTIKRRSFDKIVELTNPKLDSSNSIKKQAHTQPDLELPLHEVPRISTSFFSDVDQQDDNAALKPNEISQLLHRTGDREHWSKGAVMMHERSTSASRCSRQRRQEQRSNGKPSTPSHTAASPISRWQGPETAHYSLDQALPDLPERLDFEQSPQCNIIENVHPQLSASETDDAPEKVKDEGYGRVVADNQGHSRMLSGVIEANKMPVPRYSPGIYGKEEENPSRIQSFPLKKAMRRRNAKTVQFSLPPLGTLPPLLTLSNKKYSPLFDGEDYEEQVDLGKGDDTSPTGGYSSDESDDGSRRRMHWRGRSILRRREDRDHSIDCPPSPTYLDVEEELSSGTEVDEKESEMEQGQEVDVNEEYAVVNELLGKYTTLFD